MYTHTHSHAHAHAHHLTNAGALLDDVPLFLILLTSAIPVALPVMFNVAMAVGSMELVARGVLVARYFRAVVCNVLFVVLFVPVILIAFPICF